MKLLNSTDGHNAVQCLRSNETERTQNTSRSIDSMHNAYVGSVILIA